MAGKIYYSLSEEDKLINWAVRYQLKELIKRWHFIFDVPKSLLDDDKYMQLPWYEDCKLANLLVYHDDTIFTSKAIWGIVRTLFDSMISKGMIAYKLTDEDYTTMIDSHYRVTQSRMLRLLAELDIYDEEEKNKIFTICSNKKYNKTWYKKDRFSAVKCIDEAVNHKYVPKWHQILYRFAYEYASNAIHGNPWNIWLDNEFIMMYSSDGYVFQNSFKFTHLGYLYILFIMSSNILFMGKYYQLPDMERHYYKMFEEFNGMALLKSIKDIGNEYIINNQEKEGQNNNYYL